MSLGIGPGAIIDSVKLELLIGRGGMGDIWQGINTRDHSRVAVKVLRQEFLKSTQARERFRREAELTGQLNSTQTLKVLKYALTPERIPYIIMELLEGHDLQTRLDREGPLPLVEALEIIIEVLKALSEAHQMGIIHRDIKPSNLFKQSQYSENTQVKILDFGLATQHNHSQIEPRDRSLVGTYYFMSPEQAERGPISSQTDLYAVGATLYALLTGHPPREPSAGDKSFAHFKQAAPKLKDKHPQVKAPVKLDLIIQRCLAIAPNERPESADVLRRALEQISSTIRRRTQQADAFSLAPDQRQASWSHGTLSQNPSLAPGSSVFHPQDSRSLNLRPNPYLEEANAHRTHSLVSFLQAYQVTIIQKWTQAITERPEQSRLQSHNLKRKVRDYIEMFMKIAAGRPVSAFNSFFEELTQVSFTHPPLELIPMITCSLFRRILSMMLEEQAKAENLSPRQQQSWLQQVDEMIFLFRRQFISLANKKRLDETNNALYRLFSLGSETALFCTMAGIAINTHPRLRAALASDEKSGLTGRKIFEILSGFQPITPLFQTLRQVVETEPDQPHFLSNESNEGRAQDLVIYPYVVGKNNQKKLLFIVDVITERSITEYIPSFDEFDQDYASPQALPWLMTAEVPALTPEMLGEVEVQPYESKSFEHMDVKSKVEPVNDYGQLQKKPADLESKSPSFMHAQRIQKSGAWDNYQAEQAKELRHKRMERAEHLNDLGHLDQNDYNHSDYDLPQEQPLSDLPAAYQEPQRQYPTSVPYAESQRPYQESSSSYAEIQVPYPESKNPYAEIQVPYQDSQRSYPESQIPYHDLSSIPYTAQDSLSSESSMEVHSISDQPLGGQAHSDNALAINTNRSSSPIPPDTQDYIRSRSSSPFESLSQRPSERKELDSQAPTDPPKAVFENSIPNSDPRPLVKESPIAKPDQQSHHPHSIMGYDYNESLNKIPPLPFIVQTNNTDVEQPYIQPSESNRRSEMNHGPITFNKRGPDSNQEASNSNAPQTDQPHHQAQAYINSVNYGHAELEPIKRKNMRITSVRSSNPWLLNWALFLVVVTCLALLREPVTKWLDAQKGTQHIAYPTQPKSNPTPIAMSKRASLKPQTAEKVNDANDSVTIKVNVAKATYFNHSQMTIICQNFNLCIVPTNEGILIRSKGYKDFYVTPLQLAQAEKMLSIDLEPIAE